MTKQSRSSLLLSLLLVLFALPNTAQAVEPPRLGGPVDAFTAKYGEPIRNTGEAYSFEKCPGKTKVAHYELIVEKNVVTSIISNACPAPANPNAHQKTTAILEATTFMPTDAIKNKAFMSEDGAAGHQYRSVLLGKLLPERSAQTCSDKKVSEGTFVYVLSPERQYWILTAGACP